MHRHYSFICCLGIAWSVSMCNDLYVRNGLHTSIVEFDSRISRLAAHELGHRYMYKSTVISSSFALYIYYLKIPKHQVFFAWHHASYTDMCRVFFLYFTLNY